jgi:tRNA-dihydrouridine synthase B
MKIGTLQIDPPTVFAPLAGITNLPLRLLAKEAGCGLVCSEMVSANGLVHESAKTIQLLNSTEEEKPLSVQLFGSDGAMMAEAAQRVEAAGADIVDINFGCSVRKILKSGSGSALMREPEKAEALLKAVRSAISIPLTIKMRSGWDADGAQALALGRIAQGCGVNAVAIHPRTAKQGFGGCADWNLIARIKQELGIPVIGNGDIIAPADAVRMMEHTHCDAVMVGRAAIGNPFIFSQIQQLLAGTVPEKIPTGQRIALMHRYLDASVTYLGEKRACLMLRSRLGWFAKGLPGASRFRHSIRHIESHRHANALITAFASGLEEAVA